MDCDGMTSYFPEVQPRRKTQVIMRLGEESETHLGPSALEVVGMDWPSHCMPLVAQLEHG